MITITPRAPVVLHIVWFGLVWFYGTSTIVDYLMPDPFLYIWTVLFQIILYSISTQFSSIWPIDRTLSGATTPAQSGPGNNGNKGVLCIPQSSSITEASTSDCLSVISWSLLVGRVIPLQRCSYCILLLQLTEIITGATTSGQSWPWSNGNEGLLHIPQSTNITETSPSDCLVSYPEHSLWRGGLHIEKRNKTIKEVASCQDIEKPLKWRNKKSAPSDLINKWTLHLY